jgi:hypothetical protein
VNIDDLASLHGNRVGRHREKIDTISRGKKADGPMA